MFYALPCSVLWCALLCGLTGDFFTISYLPVLALNCDYWIAGVDVDAWSVRAMCDALFGAALCSCAMMPRAFLSPALLVVPALLVGELWLCGARLVLSVLCVTRPRRV